MIPRPELLTDLSASFQLSPGATVSGDLLDAVRLALPVLDLRPGDSGEIDVRRDPGLGEEAYRMTVGSRGVEIVAGGRAGAFYAAQSLHQLLPDASYRLSPGSAWSVPGVRIEDAPRFAWRGLHLDVARHFFPKREILRLVDLMAMHKLNRLHLHLADDQGWRVESRAYPLLHEISSHRPRTATNPGREPATYDDVPHGGYYTLDDLAEIGAYARARCVTIVPEIDVPGHASAILAAYPALGATGEPHDVLDRWGISRAILSPLPPTVEFLTTIFDELIGALGETPYVHIGGDEVVLDRWAESAEIAAYRDSLGLASANDLQAWFLRRLADALAERGARAVVWDEAFVSGRLRADTVVMPWRGMGVGRRAAAAGHDVVATPVFPLYFDYAEASSPDEPMAIGDAITVSDVAAFGPAPEEWAEEERARVIGVQAQLWTERVPDARTVDYRLWPRSCALAEVAWAGSAAGGFDERLERHLGRLDAIGVEYRPLAGPHPWQRRRPHRPAVVDVSDVMTRIDAMTHDAESTRPSV
ncbi:family 20 glycosylhydrolase [Nonomuraea phyllanthi]|uniref:beta-N-acetylhexosaminidase n=1 Tax=Nonomuraea phyllanthi TaxID=2219224 RepID=A0A5C4VE42_9ACTN|nr:beta-N-acetylhexosaminidase [Nonomuraea phyllanthi]KAB8188646.1 family 20 glycosylhydrolase [Nonomuraea phyllanthi]QFY13319.1 family 20 glycosylhydrolase [Nonomuraea phyllanthi]